MTTTTATLKSHSLRMLEAIDGQRWAECRELAAPSCRSTVNGQEMDREGWIAQGQGFYSAFPDGHHQVLDQVVEGDRVVNRALWTGTHKAPFQGIPATGRAVSVPAIMIHRFVDGRVVEHWGIFDAMTMMQQLGALGAS